MRVNSVSNLPYNFGMQKTKQNNGATNSIYSNLQLDTVNFKGETRVKPTNVDMETAYFVTNSLSTSTSGHRAVYGSKDFNEEVVQLLSLGVAKYAKDTAKENGKEPTVLIGGDTRRATKESLGLIKDTLLKQGVNVVYIEKPVPTPLHALETQQRDIDIAVLLTASHNPWADGGFNLVTNEGAIAPPEVTKQVAKNAIDYAKKGQFTESKNTQATVEKIFPYEEYKEKINEYELIDWKNISNSGISIHYDGLKGTGNNVMPQLLEDYGIKIDEIDSGKKTGPNPTDSNLKELKNAVLKDASELKIGLANDGDADRFGIIDENGKFITPNDVILLSAYHLAQNKGKRGDIVRSQATSSQIDLFANKMGLNVLETPVGFKYIAEDVIKLREEGGDILVAGEESGGLTINSHIPEKDGIIALLLMLDLVATEKKPISEILTQVKEDLNVDFGDSAFSKTLSKEEDKAIIMNRMQNIYKNSLEGDTKFAKNFTIDAQRSKEHTDSMEHYKEGGDGVKLYFTDGSSVLVRKSGTEPKVKAYIEVSSESKAITNEKIAELENGLNEIFTI